MNGRLYDPKLHRFLQPDNFVQDPSNTQNYNRYGYCVNNPLKYTDPSGEKYYYVQTPVFNGGDINISGTRGGMSFGGGSFGGGSSTSTVSIYQISATLLANSTNDVTIWNNISDGDYYNKQRGGSLNINTGLFTEHLQEVTIYYNRSDSYNASIIQNHVYQNGKYYEYLRDGKGQIGNGVQDGDGSFHPGQYLPNFKADIGPDFLKFKGLHYGVPEFESSWLTGGAITPGPFVLYPTGGSSMETYNTHEGGHFVQFLALRGTYYPLIAIPSIINTQLNWKIFDYTEKTANDLWYWWSGESSNLNKGYRK